MMVAELIFYGVREISHYTKDMLQYEGLHLILGFSSCGCLALSVLWLLSITFAFNFVQ